MCCCFWGLSGLAMLRVSLSSQYEDLHILPLRLYGFRCERMTNTRPHGSAFTARQRSIIGEKYQNEMYTKQRGRLQSAFEAFVEPARKGKSSYLWM